MLQNTKLKPLSIGLTKSKAIDFSFIKNFQELKFLSVDGMKKNLEQIAEVLSLEGLSLRGVKMNNINFIKNLKNLKNLSLCFGSFKNLDAISNVTSIRDLSIIRTRQIPDFNFLKSMRNLNSLYLEGMSQMERLPDLSGLENLNRLHIDNNSQLSDISNIYQLSKLKVFLIFFPEKIKAGDRKTMINQVYDYLKQSKTIQFSNLLIWLDDEKKKILLDKGITQWNHGMQI